MVEVHCPKCKSSLQAEKFGTYVSCNYCNHEFFNVDPGLVQKPEKDAVFVIRMVFIALFSVLTVGFLAFCLITSSPVWAGAIFPLAAAIVCLREGGFRVIFSIVSGAVVCGIAAFVTGLIGTGNPEDALFLTLAGVVIGMIIGSPLNAWLRRTSWLGERCPFCFHRGIVGAGDDVSCRHCGHTPKISAEQRAVRDLLANYNCRTEMICYYIMVAAVAICWLGGLLLAALRVDISDGWKVALVLGGLVFLILAAAAKKRFKCPRCKNLWVMVKINEKSSVNNKLKFEEVKKLNPQNQQNEDHLHFYYDKTTVTTFACKCCGHIRTEEAKSKETAGIVKN